MRLPAMYAIRHNGDKKRWVVLGLNNSFLRTTEQFEPQCVLSKEAADNFMARPGLDPRFELYKIPMNAEKVPQQRNETIARLGKS